MSYDVKDSGTRECYAGGMVRDTAAGKVDYTLVFDGPMLDRWAEHLTAASLKYSKGNWLLAEGQAELDRFRESATRHFRQWLRGDQDEDHAAAVLFNLNGYEHLKAKLSTQKNASICVKNS
jgi:hypothetical protein